MAKKVKSKLMVAGVSDMPSKVTAADKEHKEHEMKWRAEDDLRTIQRAEEVKSDKSRMNMVKTLAKEQTEALKKICK